MEITKKQLLNSPHRQWDDTRRLYDQVLMVQGKTKHESGYMHIVLIGAYREGEEIKYEVCGYPDDVEWNFGEPVRFGDNKEFSFSRVRMDCWYPQGVFQFHTRSGKFHISTALSSMTVRLVANDTPTPKE